MASARDNMPDNHPRGKYCGNVLFVSLMGIGNLIMLLPAIATFKKNNPLARIHVLTLGHLKNIIEQDPHIDEILTYPKGNTFRRMGFLLSLRGKKFEVAFHTFPNISMSGALFLLAMGAKERIGFCYSFLGIGGLKLFNTVSINPSNEDHDVVKHLKLVLEAGATSDVSKIAICLSKDDKVFAKKFLEGKVARGDTLIAMHVGSHDDVKIWPLENFELLGRKMLDKKIKILLVGGTKEMADASHLSFVDSPDVINAIGKTSLRQTGALLKKCRLMVTNDSGPMHIAAGVGTKVVGIFKYSDPRRTSPFGEGHTVIVKKGGVRKARKGWVMVDDITPDVVFSKMMKALSETKSQLEN